MSCRAPTKLLCESEVTQSHPTLCDPMDCSPPFSAIHGFSRREYWSGVPCPSPGDLPHRGTDPGLLHRRQTPYRPPHQGIPVLLIPYKRTNRLYEVKAGAIIYKGINWAWCKNQARRQHCNKMLLAWFLIFSIYGLQTYYVENVGENQLSNHSHYQALFICQAWYQAITAFL